MAFSAKSPVQLVSLVILFNDPLKDLHSILTISSRHDSIYHGFSCPQYRGRWLWGAKLERGHTGNLETQPLIRDRPTISPFPLLEDWATG